MPVVVETVTKSSTIKTFAAAQPLHDSDASKVTSKGAGLQSAQLNKDATFSVDTSRAGLLVILCTTCIHCLQKTGPLLTFFLQ